MLPVRTRSFGCATHAENTAFGDVADGDTFGRATCAEGAAFGDVGECRRDDNTGCYDSYSWAGSHAFIG